MQVGSSFDGRYEILRLLGSGGMAEVYLAHDSHLERDVALKVLLPKYARDEDFIERFRREARSAAGLNHPNIAQIYDRGEAEGTYYIAMEYLEGRSLKEIIVRHAPLAAPHVVSLSRQILEALRFAHRKDLVHRDIKPQNIIVDDEGRVKVTDFGIARAGSSTMTETGSILGTSHYLSPEQAQGWRVGASSDLYSLGVVMFEMATGQLPFTGDNPVAIAMKHVYDPPPSLRDLEPSIPEELEHIVLRALAKQPAQRYLTADEFLEDLRRFEAGEAVTAPISRGEEETRVMTPVPPVPSGGEATRVQHRDRPDRAGPSESFWDEEQQEDADSRRSYWPWLLVAVFILLLAGGAYAITGLVGGSGERVEVPGVIGLTPEEADKALSDRGLVMEVVGSEQSTEFSEGTVSRQDPEEGNRLSRGRTVRVWVAAGEETVEVPDFVGKTEAQAASELGQLDLALNESIEEASEEYDEGVVIRHEPAAGTEVAVGSGVTLWVSSGEEEPEQVNVPSLVGMNQDRAISALEELNLVPKTVEVDSDEPGGTVVRQSPESGTTVAEESVVTMYVSNAPIIQEVTVPEVIGLSESQAESALRTRGLVPNVARQPEAAYPSGEVFDQHPRPGERVDEGSTVDIIVAIPPPTTTAPSTTTTTSPSSTTTTESGGDG